MTLINVGKHDPIDKNLKQWNLRRFHDMEPEAIAILKAWHRERFFPVEIKGIKLAIWVVKLERLTVTEAPAEDGLNSYWLQYRTLYIHRKKKFKTVTVSRKLESWRHK